MTPHLDTNAAIALLNGRDLHVRERFEAARAAGTAFAISAIVHHELMYGAAHSARRDENENKISIFLSAGRVAVLAFEEADACEAADIRAELRSLATPIGPYDVLIAAHARRAGAALVTANTREFQRVPGLVVVDWSL